MKVLVTGGNGFFGSWLVRGLVDQGDEVKVLHRKSSDLSALKGVRFESVLGDITDQASLVEAARGADIIYHAAALISYRRRERPMMEQINVGGTQNVVEAVRQARVKKLVYTSSVVAVGATEYENILTEESPYKIHHFDLGYYETKRKAEEIVVKAVQDSVIDAVILNPSIMFGPGDAVKGSRKKHLLVAKGKMPFYLPGGVNIVDVQDVVKGHLIAARKGRAGHRYILGGANVFIRDLEGLLARSGGHYPPAIPVPRWMLRATYSAGRFLPGLDAVAESALIGTLFHWYDCSKAQRELGYSPGSATKAVQKSIQWCVQNGYL